MFKVFDFSFTEGCWVRSFRVTAWKNDDYRVLEWDGDSVKVTNQGQPYEFLDQEDLEGVEQMLCWAFEERKRRNDSRDTCVEVGWMTSSGLVTDDIESLLPPE